MERYKSIYFCLLSLLFLGCRGVVTAEAQTFSAGAMLGASNYNGDLSPAAWTLSETKPAFSVLGLLEANRFLSIRAGLTYTVLSGNDDNARSEALQMRNLHFKSPLWEGSIQVLIDFLGNKGRFVPYILGGVALFHFSPKAEYNGDWYDLQPLGTEGQGISTQQPRLYRLSGLAIPVGAGLRYRLNTQWAVGFEATYRRTFSDYIDDVSGYYYDNDALRNYRSELSAQLADRLGEYANNPDLHFTTNEQRGNPKTKDAYFLTGFTVYYSFGSMGKGGRERYNCYDF